VPQEKAKEFKASNGFGADSDLESQGSLIGFETPSCCNFSDKLAWRIIPLTKSKTHG